MARWRPQQIIFDSDLHGYHGEMQSSAKLHGEGEAKPFTCPHCGGKLFKVSVQFDYWDACNDLWEDEPEIKIEDYFCNLIVEGECATCRHASRISIWTYDLCVWNAQTAEQGASPNADWRSRLQFTLQFRRGSARAVLPHLHSKYCSYIGITAPRVAY